MGSNWNMFENIPSYQNKRVQQKLSALEKNLQAQYAKQIQAENDRLNLLRKLKLLEQKDGYHQTKRNITKKLSDNIMDNVWQEKELVRNKEKN